MFERFTAMDYACCNGMPGDIWRKVVGHDAGAPKDFTSSRLLFTLAVAFYFVFCWASLDPHATFKIGEKRITGDTFQFTFFNQTWTNTTQMGGIEGEFSDMDFSANMAQHNASILMAIALGVFVFQWAKDITKMAVDNVPMADKFWPFEKWDVAQGEPVKVAEEPPL